MGLLLFVQVFGNMGVVLGILPVTGMPLPFISYGGSGLVCLLMGMGIVLGISRHQN
jgi:cell division protein FtsW (lipid II flippase)